MALPLVLFAVALALAFTRDRPLRALGFALALALAGGFASGAAADTRLGATTGPIRVAGGLGTGSPSSWTPAKSGPVFCLNPGNASTLTIAMGISAAKDDCGGTYTLTQATGSAQPTVDATALLGKGGYQSVKFLASANQALFSATGGITGHADHTVCGLVRIDSPAQSTYAPFAQFGPLSTTAGANSFVGTYLTNYVAGRTGNGAPLSTTPFAADYYTPHLICKVVASQTVSLYVDGFLAAGPVLDTGYAIQAGFGTTSFYISGEYPTVHLWWGGWWTYAIPAATRHLTERWASYHYQVGTISCIGESLCFGYPAGNTQSALAYLNSGRLSHPVQTFWEGVSGQISLQILARFSSLTTIAVVGNGEPQIVILNGGTNDADLGLGRRVWATSNTYGDNFVTSSGNIYWVTDTNCIAGPTAPTWTSGSGSDGGCTLLYVSTNTDAALEKWTLGNLVAAAAALRVAGYTVLVDAVLPVGAALGCSGCNAWIATLNADLRATAGWTVVPLDDPAVTPLLAGSGANQGPTSCMYEQTYQVHPTNGVVAPCTVAGYDEKARVEAIYVKPLLGM